MAPMKTKVGGLVLTALAACGDPPPQRPTVVPVAPRPSVRPSPPVVARLAEEPLPKGVLRRLGSRRDHVKSGNAAIRYVADGRLLAVEVTLESRWSKAAPGEEPKFSQVGVTSIREADSGRKLFSTEGIGGLIAPAGDGWLELAKPVKLWSFAGSKPPAELPDRWGSLGAWIGGGREAAFLDHGRGTVLAWEPASGRSREVATYQGVVHQVAGAPVGRAVALAFRVEGRVVVVDPSGDADGYDVPPGRSQIAFDARGDVLGVAAGDELRVIDVAAEQIERVATIDTDEYERTLAMSPDGSLMAVGTHNRVAVIDRAGVVRHRLELDEDVRAIAFSPDGKQLAVREVSGHILRFASATGKQVAIPPGHDAYGVVAMSPSGRRAITAGGHVYLWDVDEGTLLEEADSDARVVAAAFVSEDVAVTLSSEGEVVRWALPSLTPSEVLGKGWYGYAPGWLASAPGGGLFIAPAQWGEKKEMALFDAGGRRIAAWPNELEVVALDSPGTVAAFVGDEALVVREIGKDEPFAELQVDGPLDFQSTRLSLSPGGDFVAMCRRPWLTLWRPKRGEVKRHGSAICDAVAVLDDRRVLVGDSEGCIRLVDFEDGIIRAARHHTRASVSISVSPRGVLVGSLDPGALLYPPTPELGPPNVCHSGPPDE